MAITEFAKAYHETMFSGSVTSFLETDPEFIERFDSFAFDEVLNQPGQGLDSRLSDLGIDESNFKIMAKKVCGLEGKTEGFTVLTPEDVEKIDQMCL